jgi:hypothetical protein
MKELFIGAYFAGLMRQKGLDFVRKTAILTEKTR